MKLIRCVSETNDGVFNCNFNADLTLTPFSQICLQNLSLARATTTASSIDVLANTVTFTVRFSSSVTILKATLPAASYTQDNVLISIASAINNKLFCIQDTASNPAMGRQFQVANKNGKVDITYATSLVNALSIDSKWTKSANVDWNDGTTYSAGDTVTVDPFNTYAFSEHPITKGCGKIQFTCGALADGGGNPDDTKGFIVGLTAQNPAKKSGDWTLSDILIGVQPNADGENVYNILNGVRTLGDTPTSEGDAVAIELNMNPSSTPNVRNAQIVVYGQGSPTTAVYQGSGSSVTLNDDTNYWAIMMMVSATDLGYPQYTPDTTFADSVDAATGSSDIGRNASYAISAQGYLEMSFEAAKLLKYNYTRYPQSGNDLMPQAKNWLAEAVMNATNRVDGYVVELMNLGVESFDSFNGGQRRDILATIVAKDDSDDIVYTAPFPVWLNLSNSRTITLRNITFRIVNTDYSALDVESIPMATLLVRGRAPPSLG